MSDLTYWDNGVIRLYHADARSIPLPDESVHCVVTSPPYWNLRDYGLAPSVWGGDSHHAHEWVHDRWYVNGGGSTEAAGGAFMLPGEGNAKRIKKGRWREAAFCQCGAWLGALGLEPTVNLYVSHIVEIFREVWRVLRKDGTCWINLGDSYSGRRDGDLKPKDLVGMPWRVAFALQDDGWWLRSPVIWDKPNPMPESVTDRLTTSHEYVFMLTKSGDRLYWAHPDRPGVRSKPSSDYRYVCDETGDVVEAPPKGWRAKDSRWRRVNLWRGHDYFFDGYAIREPLAEASVARISQATFWKQQGGPKDYGNGVNPNRSTRRTLENLARRTPSGWNVNHDEPNLTGRYPQKKEKQRGHRQPHQGFIDRWDEMSTAEQRTGGANARTVWRIAVRPFSGKHFATFPEDLPRRCIMAGTSEYGVCAECGAPWERVLERNFQVQDDVSEARGIRGANGQKALDRNNTWDGYPRGSTVYQSLGWQATCEHDAGVVPATVLDPFIGSGTTAVAAQRLGRRAVGVDASEEYLRLAEKRIGAVTLPLPLGGW